MSFERRWIPPTGASTSCNFPGDALFEPAPQFFQQRLRRLQLGGFVPNTAEGCRQISMLARMAASSWPIWSNCLSRSFSLILPFRNKLRIRSRSVILPARLSSSRARRSRLRLLSLRSAAILCCRSSMTVPGGAGSPQRLPKHCVREIRRLRPSTGTDGRWLRTSRGYCVCRCTGNRNQSCRSDGGSRSRCR